MNQQCKVCGEPAAGFHFGAFTCEGCKSFFGRSYNNLSAISECKNNGGCVINKKNRTSCKACRLRKCMSVGMSKSGSRYGRRSNWFKIHCLLQEQQQQQQQQANSLGNNNNNNNTKHNLMSGGILESSDRKTSSLSGSVHHHLTPSGLFNPNLDPRLHMHLAAAALQARRLTSHRDSDPLLGGSIDDYGKNASLTSGSSPSMSSPDSHASDSSVENDSYKRRSLVSPVTKNPPPAASDRIPPNLAFPIFSPFYPASFASHTNLNNINFVHFPSPLFSHSNSSPFKPTFGLDDAEDRKRWKEKPTEALFGSVKVLDKSGKVRKGSPPPSENDEEKDMSVDELEDDEDTSATLVDYHQEQPIDLSTNRSGSESGSMASFRRSSAPASPQSDINVDEFVDDDNLNNNNCEKKIPLDLTMRM